MTTTATHIKIDSPPAWLPAELRGRAVKHTFRFTAGERQIFKKRKKIAASVWAERHRVVTMSALPGPWRGEVTPYLAGIMDASFHEAVQTVILCKVPQSGGSEGINNCIGYAVDRAPGPVLYVFPDEMTAKENSQDRILPMIESSPRLRSYFTGVDDDKASRRIKLKHMPIYLAWASSAQRLANKPIRYAVQDELDKYPPSAGKKEASPEALVKKRTITYRWNRKIWKISTPTVESGPIWQALTVEAQVIFDYWVVCPLCGGLQLMRFSKETFGWPHEPADPDHPEIEPHSLDPERIEAEDLAWYECEHCHDRWNDTLRDRAVRAGRWRSRPTDEQAAAGEEPLDLFDYLDRHRPRKIGFHIPSWISYFIPLSEIAAAFLRSLRSLDAFKDFKNGYEALPWKQVVTSKDEDQVLKARCTLSAQTVPEDAIALTCGIDVQLNGFWFGVRAWAADMTSWLIHYGFLATWTDVEDLVYETRYPIINSEESMGIWRAAVDTGGGKKYETMTMTEETYFWLIKNRGRGGRAVWGTKGSSAALSGMLSLGNAITSTPSGKKLSGGLRILSLDTGKAKDQFHYRLQRAIEGLSGGAYLHTDTGTDYTEQILAEEKQITDRRIEEWVNPHGRDNHLLDVECLAAACVEMEFPGGGLRLLAEAEKRRQGQETAPSPGKTTSRQKKGWFKHR